MKKNLPSDTFCVLPWMHVATNASGTLRVCCNSTPGKNGLEHPDGGKYKLHKHDLREAWNSPTLTKIRQQFLDGERPEMCARCFREEDSGVKSARESWNEGWYDDSVDYNTVNPPVRAQYVDLRLGNLCNLKCRMCNPYASNQWVKEWNSIGTERYNEAPLDDDELERLDGWSKEWPNKKYVWENFMNVADTIEEIYLTGGEPTLALAQFRLFDFLIERGLNENITLKYNTNLTNIPQRMVDYWDRFHKVKLNCSIDAVGDLNRYIRYPTNWKLVEKNLARFLEMEKTSGVRVGIHTTVQIYNILHLDSWFDWIQRRGKSVYLNILNHPEYLNIRVLPTELKQLATERLESYIPSVEKLDSVLDYMWAEDWSDRWQDFERYTHTIDSSRNENILDVVPEFDKWINKTPGA